jgi:TPR repeat protein
MKIDRDLMVKAKNDSADDRPKKEGVMENYLAKVFAFLAAGQTKELHNFVVAEIARENPSAFNTMGYLYDNGLHVPVDAECAVSWYRKGQERGCLRAMSNLAESYFVGKGVSRDVEEGLRLVHEAIDKGLAHAYYILGMHYADEFDGKEADLDQALDCFERGRVAGSEYCTYSLGSMYLDGIGVEKDLNRGIALYIESVEMGDGFACAELYRVYRDLDNRHEAFKWLEKGVELGNRDARYEMGLICAKGGADPDFRKTSEDYFRLAAQQGHACARGHYGSMLAFGDGPLAQRNEGFAMMLFAAEQGISYSQYEVGFLYMGGCHVLQNYALARYWLELAAAQDEPAAMALLGEIYYFGYGVEEDHARGAEWSRRSAELGDASGQYFYGEMLRHGDGVAENRGEALYWLRSSAQKGYAHALKTLEKIGGDVAVEVPLRMVTH